MSGQRSDRDEREHAAAWSLASADRPADDPPAEVRMLADLDALYAWASKREVQVHWISTDASGRGIFAAHHGRQSRVAKGPPRERTWETRGFQT